MEILENGNEQRYYERLAYAWQRGQAERTGQPVSGGRDFRMYSFKRGHEELPRVKKVLGFLRAVQPESLLDVGSGRGVE